MRLKSWRSGGIVLSLVWLLAGGFWGNSAGLHKGDFAVKQFNMCIENSANPGDASGGCLEKFAKDYAEAIKGHWREALMVGIIPIPVAWLLVYGLMGLVRRRRAD